MGWGAWERGCRLGIELEAGGGGASRTVTAHFYFESTVRVTDNKNVLSWGGAQTGSKTPGMVRAGSGVAEIHRISWDVELAYGATRQVDLSASMTQLEYVPDRQLDAWASVTLPARDYELPNPPPTVAVARVDDRQHEVSWTTDYTGSDGARPWRWVDIDRWDNMSAGWARIVSVGWDATSYTDTSTRADRAYQYRVRAANPTGVSAWTVTIPAEVFTTPAAHTNLGWAKDGADVVLSWLRASTLGVQTEIQESVDGGSTWGETLTTVPAGTSTWRHSSPSTLTTHRYRIRPVIAGRAGAWTISTVVQLLAAPWAPTHLTPASTTVDTMDAPTVLGWRHNPADGTTQASYEIRYRSGSSGWVTLTGTTASTRTMPAAAWQHGVSVEWQVRTRGQHANFSPWSEPAVFHTGARPVVTIQTPAENVEVGTPDMPIAWSYHDAEGTAQAGAEIEVRDNTVLVWSRSVSGPTTQVMPPPVKNRRTLTVRVRVLDGSGLWSVWAQNVVKVNFVPPPIPSGKVVWDDTLGAAMITITNPAAAEGEVDAQHNQVWRSLDDGATWLLVADHVPLGGTVSDRGALAAGRSLYQVTAVSATPTTADSAPITLDAHTCWVWVSGGPGLDIIARLRAEAQVNTSRGRPKKLHRFVGDLAPTEFSAPVGRDASWGLSGKVAAHTTDTARIGMWDSWPAWEQIADLPAPLLFRDPVGRRVWVSISEVKISHQSGDQYATISCTLTQVTGP